MTSQFTKLFSFILANVHDPATIDDTALRLPCYSCMSPYLEDHYQYIAHLYRKPLSFDQHCDRHSLDRNYLFIKNCSDMCITIRINDVVGGRRRHGYVRGCLSDIHGYNHSLIRSLSEHQGCIDTTARELFLPTAQRIELEPSRLTLCGCHGHLCNSTGKIAATQVFDKCNREFPPSSSLVVVYNVYDEKAPEDCNCLEGKDQCDCCDFHRYSHRLVKSTNQLCDVTKIRVKPVKKSG